MNYEKSKETIRRSGLLNNIEKEVQEISFCKKENLIGRTN